MGEKNLSSKSKTRETIRIIPQGTVVNNLGLDRLAGPDASKQPTIWLLGVYLCMVISWDCFGPKYS